MSVPQKSTRIQVSPEARLFTWREVLQQLQKATDSELQHTAVIELILDQNGKSSRVTGSLQHLQGNTLRITAVGHGIAVPFDLSLVQTGDKDTAWFCRRESDNRILCTDKQWRHNAGSVECIKFYSSAGRAQKFGLNYQRGTVIAVHAGNTVDCCGEVSRNVE